LTALDRFMGCHGKCSNFVLSWITSIFRVTHGIQFPNKLHKFTITLLTCT
jgi:hypothetical protein